MKPSPLNTRGSTQSPKPSSGPSPCWWASVIQAVCLTAAWTSLGQEGQGQPNLLAPFTRVTEAGLDEETAFSVVGAWGDYDNDGWLDLFVGNHRNAESWLFRNNRDGTFTKATAEPVTTDIFGEHWSAAWADYDNDGGLDLIVSNHDGRSPARLYRNQGAGSFSLLSPADVGPLAEELSRTQGLAWADYDNDGRLDLFVANGDLGRNYPDVLYHQQKDGQLVPVSNTLTSPVLSSSMGSWSDYDNDGDMDLFVPHTGGSRNSLFRNEGQGRFSEVLDSGLGAIGESLGATWGDYDNDGDLDLFVNNVRMNGPVTSNFLYRNRGDGKFERITSGALVADEDHFVSSVWLDYDNDGWLDLFLTVLDGSNRLYRNRGDGTFARANQGRLVEDVDRFGSTACGDYNNDGFPDLFVTCGTIFGPAPSALYRNNGNGNSWIKVRCVGTVSNRSAIGTKIRVKAKISGKEYWQMRQIVGTEGWVTFNSLDMVIGLGDAQIIDSLRIEWPSGIVQEFHGLKTKQTLTLVERTDLSLIRASNGELDLKVKGPRQQRYRLETSPDLTNWSTVAGLTTRESDGIGTFRLPLAPSNQGRFFRTMAE